MFSFTLDIYCTSVRPGRGIPHMWLSLMFLLSFYLLKGFFSSSSLLLLRVKGRGCHTLLKPYETNCCLWIWAIQIKFDWLIDNPTSCLWPLLYLLLSPTISNWQPYHINRLCTCPLQHSFPLSRLSSPLCSISPPFHWLLLSLMHPNSATDILLCTFPPLLTLSVLLRHDRSTSHPQLRGCLTRCVPTEPLCEHQKGNGRNLNTRTTCSLISLFSPLSLPLFPQPKALSTKLQFNPYSLTPKNYFPTSLTPPVPLLLPPLYQAILSTTLQKR